MDWKKVLKTVKLRRRQYLRPLPPSRTEKLLGYTILVLVAGIGITIYLTRNSYDPNLFRLDPTLLDKDRSNAEPVRVTGGERRGNSLDGEPTRSANDPATTATAAAAPTANANDNFNLIPPAAGGKDWSLKGDLQRFGFDNLYDKVDGREDVYKNYGFQELVSGDFVSTAKADRFIQIELFEMKSPESAVGVFAAERPSHPNVAKLGREGYTDTNGAFFWKGKYYARVIGSDDEKTTQQVAIMIAQAIAEKIVDDTANVAMADPSPTKDRVPNSNALIPQNAFGYDFLRNVTSARYKVGKAELTAFVMKADTPDKAKQVVAQFRKALEESGKVTPLSNNPEGYHAEVYGSHYVVFAEGNIIGGVVEADAKDSAIKLGQQLADYLKNPGKK
jgi:hypothetical protein